MRRVVAISLSAFTLLTGCATPANTELITLTGPTNEQATFTVEIAETDEQRETGLMHREQLNASEGMLFVFDDEHVRSFWMKNTQIALDILFFDANGEFVSRDSMEPCLTERCRSYTSSGPAMYALEVEQGHATAAAIGSGWTLLR